MRIAMISDDSQAVANLVAEQIEIGEVSAQVLPADKASSVRRFRVAAKTWEWWEMVSTMRRHPRQPMWAFDWGGYGQGGGKHRDRARAQRPAGCCGRSRMVTRRLWDHGSESGLPS